MMDPQQVGLAWARCAQHPERQAVVRCPACRDFFCRECIAEHQGRLLCRACLVRATDAAAPAPERRGFLVRRIRQAASVAGAVGGLLVAWLFFYSLGRVLLLLPTGTEAANSAVAAPPASPDETLPPEAPASAPPTSPP